MYGFEIRGFFLFHFLRGELCAMVIVEDMEYSMNKHPTKRPLKKYTIFFRVSLYPRGTNTNLAQAEFFLVVLRPMKRERKDIGYLIFPTVDFIEFSHFFRSNDGN